MAVQPAAAPTTSLPPTQQVDYTALLKALQAAPNTAGLAKSAAAQAGQQTDATVQGIRAEQDRINRQAAVRAQQIDAATMAAANQLTGLHLADRLGSSLRTSAHDLAGLASGYSGQLQQTVGDAGDELARHLAGLGAPGGVPSTAAQAGNVLYGLGGTLPASTLLTDAPFVEAAARALPGETLGYGRQQAAGALGQGAERAGALDPQITAAYARLPALQRSILNDLQSQASKSRQDAIANTFKALSLQQQGFTAEATRAYRDAQLSAQAAKANTDAYYKGVAAAQAGQRIDQTSAHNTALESAATTRNDLESARVNNDVTKYNNSLKPRYDAGVSRSLGFRADQNGQPISGKITPLPGFKANKDGTGVVPVAKPSASGKKGGLTRSQRLSFQGSALSLAEDAFRGVKDASGQWLVDKDTGVKLEPLDYASAVLEGQKAGIPLSILLPALAKFYIPGDRGRPETAQTIPAGQFFGSLPSLFNPGSLSG